MYNNLYKIKYKPYYFYSFTENKWFKNDNNLNENDIVTYIDEIDEKYIIKTIVSPINTAASTEMSKKILKLSNNFWKNYYSDKSQQNRITLLKKHFKIYLTNNQKTIIFTEFLEEIK